MLFLIRMEGLSSKLRKMENGNKLKGIKIRRTISTISHLLLADDCYIFSKKKEKDEENIKEFLDEFSKV